MNKTIYFFRHGELKGKFNDYNKLNYIDFNNLLLKKIEPNVDIETIRKKLHKLDFIKNCKKIFCSKQNRATQTAEIFREFCNAEIIKTSLLDEVEFKEGILTKKEFKNGMKVIRKTILTKWYTNQFSEEFEESIGRFKKFLQLLQKTKEKEIICITHGWFMRIIQIYSKGKEIENVSLKELIKEESLEYLTSVKICLK